MVNRAAQLSLGLQPVVGLFPVSLARANELLVEFGHYLGPCRRPFGAQAWALDVVGSTVAVAVSASTVSSQVASGDDDLRFARGEVVELARLASSERWATRVMLRLWREVAAPAWPYWSVRAAVAYSQNARHDGDTYRFDGWRKVSAGAGSSGGGSWSSKRLPADVRAGRKTLWLWKYGTVRDDSGETGPLRAGLTAATGVHHAGSAAEEG